MESIYKMIQEEVLQEINEARQRKKKMIEDNGISILDQVLEDSGKKSDEKLSVFVKDFIKQNGPTIYAFTTDKVKDAIKIGFTDQHPEKRISQWKEVYGKGAGEVECIGYWSCEEFNTAGERVFFWDHAIHKKVRDRGYKQLGKEEFLASLTDQGRQVVDLHYSREFFNKYKDILQGNADGDEKEELSKELIEDIIILMKKNIKEGIADFKTYSFDESGKQKEASEVWGNPQNYSNTPLQIEAIDNGVKALKAGKKNLLMAAVMRFGKTHASYEIVKKSGAKRVIVCSAKADVRTAWREDINHVDFYKDFVFIEVDSSWYWHVTHFKDGKLITERINVFEDTLEHFNDKTIVLFFTLQDMAGSADKVKGIKSKHKGIFDREFDLVIVDETHYGSHAEKYGAAINMNQDPNIDYSSYEDDIRQEQKTAEEAKAKVNSLSIKYKAMLQVSGTPYYILAGNEMLSKDAEVICKVSYNDMIKARDQYEREHIEDEDKSNSPYFGIPTLNKIGLKLTKECVKVLSESGATDSLTELFRVKNDKFVHELAVESLMKSLFGNGTSDSLAFLANKHVEGNKVCKHTAVVLPRIDACVAMKNLLKKIINTNERKIFELVSKNPDLSSIDAINRTLEDLDNKGKKSILLTVNKYLTGVSIPCLDSMIYLKNATSPQEYDQNIFRLCTRYVKTVKDPDDESRSKKINMKDNVYLIDFNISNMFNMVANSAKMKAAAEGNATTERISQLMDDELNAIPIYAELQTASDVINKMHEMNHTDMLEIYSGYNKDKKIEDIANDDMDLFSGLFKNEKFQMAVLNINIKGDKSKNFIGINKDGTDTIDTTTIANLINNGAKDSPELAALAGTDLSTRIKTELAVAAIVAMKTGKLKSKNSSLIKEVRERFKAITKNLLYCNLLCLDDPCKDMESLIETAAKDQDFAKDLKEFGINLEDINTVYNMMDTSFKQKFNSMLLKMALIKDAAAKEGPERLSKALEGLGKLDKNEVITPPSIVEKMIDKLPASAYTSAKTILLVNEKKAEFCIGLFKKFGKNVVSKCRIVPSSHAGKKMTEQILKSEGLSEYINTIILDIKDVNGDGKYNVNDFLEMSNNDITRLAGANGKFDVCLMNPPYSGQLHTKFLEKTLQISDKVVSIQPIGWLLTRNQKNKLTNIIDNSDTYIDIVDGNKAFEGITIRVNVAIQTIDTTKKGKIHIFGKEYDKCEDIKTWSEDNYLEKFIEKISNQNDSLQEHVKYSERNYTYNTDINNYYYIKIKKMRGNQNQNGVADDFYTLISKNTDTLSKNTGIYRNLFDDSNNSFLYFIFKTESELNNFINYIKTDFVRGCLRCIKTGKNLHQGELKYIPWQDFSNPVFARSPKQIDDYLFKKYNISNDIRQHIEEILPDYYGIR